MSSDNYNSEYDALRRWIEERGYKHLSRDESNEFEEDLY